MSIVAFTNNVGRHDRQEERFGYHDYKYIGSGGNTLSSERRNRYNKPVVETSFKSDTVKTGGHQAPTNYTRYVAKMVADQPYKLNQSYWTGDSTAYEELVDYMSTDVNGLGAYYPYMDDDNAINESRVKALNNLGEAKASLGADLATIHQTLDLFSDTVMPLARSALALKHGNIRGALNALGLNGQRSGFSKFSKDLANAWLQLQYGWKPLAQSASDVQQALFEKVAKGALLHGVGRGKWLTAYDVQKGNMTLQINGKSSARTDLYARLETPSLHQLQSLGVINPASVAWELTPWSFAIDWFVPVGATLEAMTATVGLSFYGGQTTLQKKATIDGTYQESWFSPWNVVDSGHYREEHFFFQRFALDSFPVPRFYADQTPLSTPRALNALALVRQLFV